MYQVIHRPAQRMERSLPYGSPTGWSSSFSMFNHTSSLRGFSSATPVIIPTLFSLACLPYILLKRLLYVHLVTIRRTCTKDTGHSLIVHPYSNSVRRLISRKLFLTLINMGADPIINSANQWHGCHHSNQGGKIQCQ